MASKTGKWAVMARYGQEVKRCKGLDGKYLSFNSEAEAQAVAKKYRDTNGNAGGYRPHYYAILAQSEQY